MARLVRCFVAFVVALVSAVAGAIVGAIAGMLFGAFFVMPIVAHWPRGQEVFGWWIAFTAFLGASVVLAIVAHSWLEDRERA